MSLRTVAFIRYRLAPQTAMATASSSNDGVASGKAGILLTGTPEIDPGQEVIDTAKATGLAERWSGSGREYQQAQKSPSAPIEFEANVETLAELLYSLFQAGTTEGATASIFEKKFVPPTSGDVNTETWLSFCKQIHPSGTSASHRLVGGVAESVELGGEIGGALKATATLRGYDLETDYDVGSDDFTPSSVAPLLFKNSHVVLGNIYNSGTIETSSGGTAVTGTGTFWTDNVSAGDYLWFYDTANSTFRKYQIASVGGGDTSITLTSSADVSTSGVYYGIGAMIDLKAFSITIANNLKAQFYNNGLVRSFLTGDYTGEGSITIPFDPRLTTATATVGGMSPLNRFLSQRITPFYIWWGDAIWPWYHANANWSSGVFSIAAYLRYTGANLNLGDDEVGWELPFSVSGYRFDTGSISSIASAVVTGSGTSWVDTMDAGGSGGSYVGYPHYGDTIQFAENGEERRIIEVREDTTIVVDSNPTSTSGDYVITTKEPIRIELSDGFDRSW